MPSSYDHSGPKQSLLDRLTDMDPESGRDPHRNSWQEMRDYKASLCRDLAALLNTRRAEEDFNAAYVECRNSILTYGVADFTSYNLKSGFEQERVRQSIERAIRHFEPRLSGVMVEVEPPDSVRPVLKFHIEGMLRIPESGSESVFFNATLHRDSRRVSVSGAD